MRQASALSTSYQTSAPRWLETALGVVDAVVPGELGLARELTRRSLWGVLPAVPTARPDSVRRLAVTVDLDYQADTDALPGLVELVGRHCVSMSVASVSSLVVKDPDPYERAAARGHEIVNHSATHPDNPVLNPDEEFWHLSAARMTEEVGTAQDFFEALLGSRPTGFRTPHFKDAHRLVSVLEGFPELTYLSSGLDSRAPTGAAPHLLPRSPVAGEDLSQHFAPRDPAGCSRILQIPLTSCPAHRWSPFCSWHGIRAGAAPGSGAGQHSLVEWETLWRTMLQRSADAGLVVVYLDPQDLMRDAETAETFSRMLGAALDDGWQPVTLAEIESCYRPGAAGAER